MGTLQKNGAIALAKIFDGSKTSKLEPKFLELDEDGSDIDEDTGQARTPTTPNPADTANLTQTRNEDSVTVSYSIPPSDNQGTWKAWFLHFKSDLSEALAAGLFESPGVNHDGSQTDVVEIDVFIVEG